MKRKITLKQIAKELDVSISTVSKALKDSIEISDDTKEKVQAFARLYNYKPNNIALSLKNRKTKTIGVIIPEIVHYFFSKVISGIEREAMNRGYNLIIGLSNESFDTEVINMETLANGSIDGFILSTAKQTLQLQDYHHIKETIDQGMPIVMFDRVIEGINCDKVVVDDFSGAFNAVNKLLSNNCTAIGLLTTKDYVNVGSLRTQGYLKAHEEHGLNADPRLILKVDDKLTSEVYLNVLEKEIEQFFRDNPSMDGLFAVNELYAITAMNVARRLGIKIPDEMQIIGFTDGLLSRHASPSLTTIRQHGEQIGKTAAQLLMNRLENEDEDEEFQTIVVETQLIERETTKLFLT